MNWIVGDSSDSIVLTQSTPIIPIPSQFLSPPILPPSQAREALRPRLCSFDFTRILSEAELLFRITPDRLRRNRFFFPSKFDYYFFLRFTAPMIGLVCCATLKLARRERSLNCDSGRRAVVVRGVGGSACLSTHVLLVVGVVTELIANKPTDQRTLQFKQSINPTNKPKTPSSQPNKPAINDQQSKPVATNYSSQAAH